MLQNKKATLIVGAILFLAVIFFLKNESIYKNKASQEAGLTYGNIAVQDLLSKDTDLDGIQDWEESLWGTDPTKKDTNDDGTPDSTEIAKMKTERELATGDEANVPDDANLTQTDKFSRELFSTVAALNQAGEIDDNTIEKLSTSLNDQIKNVTPKKIYLISEIEISTDNNPQAYQAYSSSLDALFKKTYTQKTENVLDILKEFIGDGDNVNTEALMKLDPIIDQTSKFMNGMVLIKVPSAISQEHLDVVNSLERLNETLSNIQKYENDVIVAMGGVSKFEENNNLYQASIDKLLNAMTKKLTN
ncbi:MAG: hypothetical protein KBC06_01040 [Candidatus Pacebacteria bacterium]|nr:hypothetical protein [Candidatus Paceibacterota bacterium]